MKLSLENLKTNKSATILIEITSLRAAAPQIINLKRTLGTLIKVSSLKFELRDLLLTPIMVQFTQEKTPIKCRSNHSRRITKGKHEKCVGKIATKSRSITFKSSFLFFAR